MNSGPDTENAGSRFSARDDGADDSPLTAADFDEVFADEDLAGDGSPLLLAVSGGPDSTALMHAAAAWAGAPALFVASVDHGLRPEARAEAEAVGDAAIRLGLPHAILTWDGRAHGRVSQEAARQARYRLLADHAAAIGAARFATAHTFDDQVETILIRLAAGSGLSGLTGMGSRTRRGALLHLRPFLHLRKAALVATCRARNWGFAEDPTNRDPRYARPRWRALADLLAGEGLTPQRVVRLGGRLRRADIALDAVADSVAAGLLRMDAPDTARLDFARLSGEPDEIVLRVLLRGFEAAGAESIRLERLETAFAALLAARLGGKALRRTLGGRVLALDSAGGLVIGPEPPRFRGR